MGPNRPWMMSYWLRVKETQELIFYYSQQFVFKVVKLWLKRSFAYKSGKQFSVEICIKFCRFIEKRELPEIGIVSSNTQLSYDYLRIIDSSQV